MFSLIELALALASSLAISIPLGRALSTSATATARVWLVGAVVLSTVLMLTVWASMTAPVFRIGPELISLFFKSIASQHFAFLAIRTFATAKSSRWSFLGVGGAGAVCGYVLGAAMSSVTLFVLGWIALAACLASVVHCHL